MHATGVPRPVAVNLEPRFLSVWLKGLRGQELLTWEEIYWFAADKAARRRLADRAKQKGSRK